MIELSPAFSREKGRKMSATGKTYPWFWFYPADFLSSQKVRVMTTAEVGAYFTLLCYAWMNDPPAHLPNDEDHLRELCKMTPEEWNAARKHIMACWKETDDGKLVYNQRLLLVRKEAEVFSSRQRARVDKRWRLQEEPVSPPYQPGNTGSIPDCTGSIPDHTNDLVIPKSHSSSHSHTEQADTAPGGSSVLGADTAIEDPACVVSSGLVMEFVTAWNALGAPFAHLKSLGPRQNALAACWREAFFREHWQSSLRRMAASAFCSGCGERGWIADVGWFLKPATVHELDEGKYDNRSPATPASKPIPGRRSEMNESDKWKDVVGA